MKSLYQDATGKQRVKYDTQDLIADRFADLKTIIKRSDGSISVDKTAGLKSRPKQKQVLRQANRAIKKSARQKLKKELDEISGED